MNEKSGLYCGDSSVEIRLKGNAVSRGIAIGRVVCLHGQNTQFFRTKIEKKHTDREIERLASAFAKTSFQLTSLSKENGTKSEIFSAHRSILEDRTFRSKIESNIVNEQINAEWAISIVADSYISRFKAIPDEHLRERYIDVDDVAERLLSSFSKGMNTDVVIPTESIVAAEELRPSALVGRDIQATIGCITEHGGWTSHTFILARELGIPAVTGLTNLLRCLESGQTLIVDGFKGEIVVNPTSETLKSYIDKAGIFRSHKIEESQRNLPLRTLDSREVIIRVNADTADNAKNAQNLGAKGVGLYRSEYLFNIGNHFPTEDEQFEAYKSIGNAAGADGAKIRIFDLSIEQISHMASAREKNPALGLRGIRLSLTQVEQMRCQFRAILRAAAVVEKIDIILPMISGVREIREAKAILIEETHRLEAASVPIGKISVGAMIEIPSAVLVVEEIINEVDFLCLGTNDLVQYLLAVDRDNESVADWFRTLHPAVIKSILKVIKAGISVQKTVIVCGEMAGSPFYTPMLIGLGATEFSMNLYSISRIMAVVRGIAFEEAVELVKSVEKCVTAEEIEEKISLTITQKWLHLYPEHFMEQRNTY